jgi:hypothetical protein
MVNKVKNEMSPAAATVGVAATARAELLLERSESKNRISALWVLYTSIFEPVHIQHIFMWIAGNTPLFAAPKKDCGTFTLASWLLPSSTCLDFKIEEHAAGIFPGHVTSGLGSRFYLLYTIGSASRHRLGVSMCKHLAALVSR